jgi:TolB-like protein
VKLLDFGIARQFNVTTTTISLQSGKACDSDRSFAGTLAYTPPEALLSSRIDTRGDLYSLGVLLFELATGTRPFSARSPAALIEQILHQAAPDLIPSTNGRSAGLGDAVKRLLAKDPEARYQSAHAVQIELAVAEREFEIGPIISSAQGNKRSLAVLPFRLLTPDPASEFLSVALADALINQLGSHREIIVRPTNSILRYANRIMDPLLAARELNTDTCVEGSIQKVGSRIRVHVQVWDTNGRRSLASAKHEADDTELFQLQDHGRHCGIRPGTYSQTCHRATATDKQSDRVRAFSARRGLPISLQPVGSALGDHYVGGSHSSRCTICRRLGSVGGCVHANVHVVRT